MSSDSPGLAVVSSKASPIGAMFQSILREVCFMWRDRSVLVWLILVLCLSSVAVWSGLTEVKQQNATLERLIEADQEDRLEALSKQKDWGGAAYYSFHLTYDAPSNFAFAALGQRDIAPWKHRIRMLALEGQIYEHDAGNPALSVIGRFDFSFFAVFVLPLILIVLLYDLRASERSSGRYNLLITTAEDVLSLWYTRAFLRLVMVFLVAIIPLAAAAAVSGASLLVLLSASLYVLAYLLFWSLLCYWVGSWQQSAAVLLATLVGVWILLTTIVPAGGRMAIEYFVPTPAGAEILMTQREAVNTAWDLPKEATMVPFLERHPQWSNYSDVSTAFEWKWYYAFQQVGDQQTESLSHAFKEGKIARDQWAGFVALLAPPALLERSLQKLAVTDVYASLRYEQTVRDFHAELRAFYYPGLFKDLPFDQSVLERLPAFGASQYPKPINSH